MELSQDSFRLTRDDLYALVWTRPASRIAVEFGITGRGLAKICERLKVPVPPRGYWNKKSAGLPVVQSQLQRADRDIPQYVEIVPTYRRKDRHVEQRHEILETRREATNAMAGWDEGIHPSAGPWFGSQEAVNAGPHRTARSHAVSPLYRKRPPRSLSRFDLKKLHLASGLIYGFGHLGHQVELARDGSNLTVLIEGVRINCSVVEARRKEPTGLSERPTRNTKSTFAWENNGERQKYNLVPSGLARFSIRTFVTHCQSVWVEANGAPMSRMIPDIIAGVLVAARLLAKEAEERREREAALRVEAEKRAELERIKAADARAWLKFNQAASAWQSASTLRAFVSEMERDIAGGADILVDGRWASEWIAWARAKIDTLDPLLAGLSPFLKQLSIEKHGSEN